MSRHSLGRQLWSVFSLVRILGMGVLGFVAAESAIGRAALPSDQEPSFVIFAAALLGALAALGIDDFLWQSEGFFRKRRSPEPPATKIPE